MNVCPALVSNLPTPTVMWYQTDASVILRIMLTDVDDYFLLVDEDHVRFSTTIKDRPYYLCLNLFGAVIPEKCTHRNIGREIRVMIPKAHRWTRWTRLFREREYSPHVVADPEKMGEDEIVFARFIKKDWDDSPGGPEASSSDCSESEDEMMDALIDHMDVF